MAESHRHQRRQTSAHAEMDPSSSKRGKTGCSNLRSRGDGPLVRNVGALCATKPPLTRRWTWLMDVYKSIRDQTSAHAEMDLPLALSRLGQLANLRSRGDGPHSRFTTFRSSSKPPLTRRWTPRTSDRRDSYSQTSAHAEMDLLDDAAHAQEPPNLRSRGDGPPVCKAQCRQGDKPPLTRRWTLPDAGQSQAGKQTSAHAEMDLRRTSLDLS